MEIEHPEELSPYVLLGVVNEKLRLECDSLAQLADDMGMTKRAIEYKLEAIHYVYQPLNNQFVPEQV